MAGLRPLFSATSAAAVALDGDEELGNGTVGDDDELCGGSDCDRRKFWAAGVEAPVDLRNEAAAEPAKEASAPWLRTRDLSSALVQAR